MTGSVIDETRKLGYVSPMPSLIFVTHPEVVIDPQVPVPDWPLSGVGRARMENFAQAVAGRNISAIYASAERKARDGAEILASRLGLPIVVDPDLGENDRSATGYIAPPEFWEVVAEFFGRPHESIRGWERAVDAQTRIVKAVHRAAADETSGDIVIVSHGGVGSLLTDHLQKLEIGKGSRPSHPGGGCFLVTSRNPLALQQDWRTIEDYQAA
ncbi:histidine phosphatase family protein [Microvirga puerhi]|uniref:Phosphoglycerate mutase family protein n=1 Tax=Microvirga puerhi TaxID=2876078 RepID=A0ABS7VKX4_9HYPH|nr:histidine phosphatase family protein [Microvirga puerhi]MBZ6075667.1 phosphoglycerate mutase family protein [Microvirga puerhi]